MLFFCPVDAENVQRELEMLSQSAASSDSKPNSLQQARGANNDLHSTSHSQSNGVHSGPNTTKNIANGLPSMFIGLLVTCYLSSSCHVAHKVSTQSRQPSVSRCHLYLIPKFSSIPLFPFLSPPSFSMLSLVFPVFAAPLGPRLMLFCSHCLVLSS